MKSRDLAKQGGRLGVRAEPHRRVEICAPSVCHRDPIWPTGSGRAISVFSFLEPKGATETYAGGGTRTPDTRIMIPQPFGSVEPNSVEMAHGWRTNPTVSNPAEVGRSGLEPAGTLAAWPGGKPRFEPSGTFRRGANSVEWALGRYFGRSPATALATGEPIPVARSKPGLAGQHDPPKRALPPWVMSMNAPGLLLASA